jgi:hypothetical protein
MTSIRYEDYVPDIEKWKKHFHDMAKGLKRPDRDGFWNVDSDPVRVEPARVETPIPQIQMVTPVAAAVERAKSELANEPKVNKRNPPTRKSPTKKITKNKNRRRPAPDVFDT